jgi:hypothetical protein
VNKFPSTGGAEVRRTILKNHIFLNAVGANDIQEDAVVSGEN